MRLLRLIPRPCATAKSQRASRSRGFFSFGGEMRTISRLEGRTNDGDLIALAIAAR